jgi:hypothetical protein
VNTVPVASDEATSIVPPCAITISRAMYRPSPIPPRRSFERAALVTVLDRVPDQIRQNLPQACRIPLAIQVPRRFEVHVAFRMGSSQLAEDLAAKTAEIQRARGKRDAASEPRSREVAQIVNHAGHHLSEIDHPRRDLKVLFVELPRSRQDLSGKHHRVERRAQVVTQGRKKKLPGLVDAVGVTSDGFGQRLVDRLVESSEIVEVALVGIVDCYPPQLQDARAQRAVFRDDFDEIEAVRQSGDGVLMGGPIQTIALRSATLPF